MVFPGCVQLRVSRATAVKTVKTDIQPLWIIDRAKALGAVFPVDALGWTRLVHFEIGDVLAQRSHVEQFA